MLQPFRASRTRVGAKTSLRRSAFGSKSTRQSEAAAGAAADAAAVTAAAVVSSSDANANSNANTNSNAAAAAVEGGEGQSEEEELSEAEIAAKLAALGVTRADWLIATDEFLVDQVRQPHFSLFSYLQMCFSSFL